MFTNLFVNKMVNMVNVYFATIKMYILLFLDKKTGFCV